jgi:hypothetical protein
MIEIEKFREQGYIYDSIENYSNLIDFNKLKDIKNEIDSINYKIPSKYDYWYKYNNLSYIEELKFENFLLRDSNIKSAEYVFDIAHKYQIDKMQRPELYPTWVFGTSMNNDIDRLINGTILKDFQENFVKHYYSDKLNPYKGFLPNFKLQFYNEGCEIKLHDDGRPADRLCVFIYFLNNEWSEENGGHLVIHTQNNQKIKINPTFPNFIVLDSDVNLFHEVEMVKKGVKYNIVCFYSGEKT